MDHHQAFSIEDGKRGETDLVEMEIDTGESSPKSQKPRRMPFAVRQEVARQLKKMQDAGVYSHPKAPGRARWFLSTRRTVVIASVLTTES